VIAYLANNRGPISAAAVARGFKQGKKVEKKIEAVLASLARLGHVVPRDDGYEFGGRRITA
jgi:hypothetical protein